MIERFKEATDALGIESESLLSLPTPDLAKLGRLINAEVNLRQQNENLNTWSADFATLVDTDFKQSQNILIASFVQLVGSLRILESESVLDSYSSDLGIIKLAVLGLADGVTVSRSRDTFSVDEGRSLRERNEIRIKVGGLDAYSGYWLALDSPVIDHKDALQEEGIDTLQRLISATSLPVKDPVVEDALQYPFIAALVSPFGPQAIQPFEGHLSLLHQYYGHESGGSWFKVPKRDSNRSSAEDRNGFISLKERPRAALTSFEEAELEIEKLDL